MGVKVGAPPFQPETAAFEPAMAAPCRTPPGLVELAIAQDLAQTRRMVVHQPLLHVRKHVRHLNAVA